MEKSPETNQVAHEPVAGVVEDMPRERQNSKEDEASSSREDAEQAPSTILQGFPLICVVVGICIASFLMSMDVFIIATAIPSITAEFHDTVQIPWYPAAYSLTTCALLPLTGKLASVFSLRWVYQIFFAIFLLGSILCGAAQSSNMFIVGRAVAGVGAAGIASAGSTIVVTVSSPAKRPMFMALSGSTFALGLILAPVIGGALTDRVSWRWCFWINLPAGALTLATQFFFFRPRSIHRAQTTRERLQGIDLLGCLIFVPACFLIMVAMQWGGTRYPWGDDTIIGLFAGGGVMVIIFIAWQWRMGRRALIPGEIMGRRQIALSCLFALFQLGGLAVMSYYLPQWFQAVRGVDPLESGVRVLPSVLAQIVSLILVGALANKVGYYNPWFLMGSMLMCIGAGLYTTLTAFDTPSREWIGYQVLQGLGVGMTMQLPVLVIQQDLNNSPLLPIGVSLGLFSQYFGAAVEQVIAGSIFNTYLKSRLSEIPLNQTQIEVLLQGGTAVVSDTAKENFPNLVRPILEAYNYAITRAFFVPVAGCGLSFLLMLGLKWNRIIVDQKSPKGGSEEQEQQEKRGQQDQQGEQAASKVTSA